MFNFEWHTLSKAKFNKINIEGFDIALIVQCSSPLVESSQQLNASRSSTDKTMLMFREQIMLFKVVVRIINNNRFHRFTSGGIEKAPFLKIGHTIAVFQMLGILPCSIDISKSIIKGNAIEIEKSYQVDYLAHCTYYQN